MRLGACRMLCERLEGRMERGLELARELAEVRYPDWVPYLAAYADLPDLAAYRDFVPAEKKVGFLPE